MIAKLSYQETPRFVNPMNAMPGLYTLVLASERTTEKHLLEFVRKDVSEHGYNPDGRAMVGIPSQYGVTSLTYAIWFYSKERGAA